MMAMSADLFAQLCGVAQLRPFRPRLRSSSIWTKISRGFAASESWIVGYEHNSEGLKRALVVAEYERHGHRLRFSASA